MKKNFLDKLEDRSKVEGVRNNDRMADVDLSLLADKIAEKLRGRKFGELSKSSSDFAT